MPDPDPKPPVTGDPDPAPKPPTDPPAPSNDDLAAMREALKKANKEAADARGKLQQLEDAGKTELQRLTDENNRLKQEVSTATVDSARMKVALAKGLTPSQAKRLVGATQEELEADADELLADLGPAKPAGNGQTQPPTPPGGKPREQLIPGNGDPNQAVEETDIKKLGEQMFASGL